MKMMNRWFTRYLHGVENDVEKDPRAWIVREKDVLTKPTPYDDYPNPDRVRFKIAECRDNMGEAKTALG